MKKLLISLVCIISATTILSQKPGELGSITGNKFTDAATLNRVDIIQKMLKEGTNVNTQTKDRSTALMWAAKGGYLKVVQVLINAKAKVNMQNKSGNTALTYAAHGGHSKTVEALIKAGAKVNRKNKQGNSALMLAAIDGDLNSVNILIESNADLELKNKNGFTALDLAKRFGHRRVERALRDALKLSSRSELEKSVRKKYGIK